MTHTTPTSTPPDAAGRSGPETPTFGEMLGELMDLSAGLVVGLLPLFLLTVPAIVLFVMLPAVLLIALTLPLAVIGVVLAGPPYLVVRWRRRRRRRR